MIGKAWRIRHPRILVVRREQIGDLVCTTPLLHMLRLHFPSAFIACLVNSYAAQVLEGNPDVDRVYVYTKPRHSKGIGVSIRTGLHRLWLFLALLFRRFDYAILATTPYLHKDIRLLRSVLPGHTVALGNEGNPAESVDIPAHYEDGRQLHIVEKLGALTSTMGIPFERFPARVFPDVEAIAAVRKEMARSWPSGLGEIIGVHISARAPSQCWPECNYVELMRELHHLRNCRFMLFWSPGEKGNVYYPGDDEKMESIVKGAASLPILAYRTETVRYLIAGLSVCDHVICPDGGVMHLAAALKKPSVCLFGIADPSQWHPWEVPHTILRPESRNVADIPVDAVVEASQKLFVRKE